MLARIPYKKRFSPFSEYDVQVAEKYIKLFGLEDYTEARLIELPGAIFKRALIAFSFIMETKAVLIDNPTSDMDIPSIKMLQRAIARYVIDGGNTVIIASNDLNFVSQTADRIVVIEDGSVALDGDPSIIDPDMVKRYFGVDVFISKNVYNGRPNVNLFPER